MPVSIDRPSPVDITKSNPTSKHYITTDPTKVIPSDDDPDGSIRIIFTPGETEAHIEAKADGVYNDTGFRFASSSISIGRDMTLSAVAGHLETNNPSALVGHVKGLIPHIEFDDDGTGQPETPILDAEEIFDVYVNAVSEIISTSIGIDLGVVPSRVIEHSFHEVGTVGATDPVTVSVYVGTDNTGILINQRTLPASDLVADTQLDIDYDNDLGFESGANIFTEFTSDTAFSLKTDVSGNPLTSHEGHELAELELLTENLVYDQNFDQILDNSFNPVYSLQFP